MIVNVSTTMANSTAHFAANPILLDMGVNNIRKSHRVGVRAQVVSPGGEVMMENEFTQPVVQVTGSASDTVSKRFDLHEIAHAFFETLGELPAIGSAPSARNLGGYYLMALPFERYIDENSTQKTVVWGTEYQTNLLPGGLTDGEQQLVEENPAITTDAGRIASALLGSVSLLTRKPTGELLHPGAPWIVPFTASAATGVTAKVDYGASSWQGAVSNGKAWGRNILSLAAQQLSSLEPGTAVTATVSGAAVAKLSAYCGDNRPNAYHFIFLNGFGMPETFTCYALAEEIAKFDTETRISASSRRQTAYDTTFATKTQQKRVLSLSSGILSREWGAWFVSEFLHTPRAWMLTGDGWREAVIIPDDEITLWDEAGSSPVAFEFEVQLSVASGGAKPPFLRN